MAWYDNWKKEKWTDWEKPDPNKKLQEEVEWIKKQERYYIEKMKNFEQEILSKQDPMPTPEAKVKARVKQVLANVNAYYIMPNTSGYGTSGAPDFVVCLRGRFVGIECKAGKNQLSQLQAKNLREIEKYGGVSMVVDESTNMTELQLNLIYLMEND